MDGLLQAIATNPNAGIPVLGIIFGITLFFATRGDKTNDGKLLDIFGQFVITSNTWGQKLDVNTTALQSVNDSIQSFSTIAKQEHVITRSRVSEHDKDIMQSFEIFGNTMNNTVGELRKIADITNTLFGQLSVIGNTAQKTNQLVQGMDSKTDAIIMTLETNKTNQISQLDRIIELLESIRQETKDYYEQAFEKNTEFFNKTNKRLNNIEQRIVPIVGGENEQKAKEVAPDDHNIRDDLRDDSKSTNSQWAGSDTGSNAND